MHWSLLPDVHLFGVFSHGESRIILATWIAIGIVVGTFWLVLRKMSDSPSGVQSFVEYVHEELSELGGGLMGPSTATYIPFVASIFFFVFVSNYMGLVPGLVAPTSNLNTPLALALIVFLSFLVLAIAHQGVVGFIKHLAGPIPALAPVMIPIEIISLVARPFSLTLRLFINMTAGHMLVTVLFSLLPISAVIWMGFEAAITCWIQAFVFALLTMIYFGESVTHPEKQHS